MIAKESPATPMCPSSTAFRTISHVKHVREAETSKVSGCRGRGLLRDTTIPTRAIVCLDDRFFPASFMEVRSISLSASELGLINPRVCSERKFMYRRRAARLLA